MPKHVIAKSCESIDAWGEDIKEKIADANISGLESENEGIYVEIGDEAKKFMSWLQSEELPKVLKESIESCHKANVAFQNIFEMEKVDLPTFDPGLSAAVLVVVKNFVKKFFVIPAVVDMFKRHSIDRQVDEQIKMEEFVDCLCGKMKEELSKQEKPIANTISQSLK